MTIIYGHVIVCNIISDEIFALFPPLFGFTTLPRKRYPRAVRFLSYTRSTPCRAGAVLIMFFHTTGQRRGVRKRLHAAVYNDILIPNHSEYRNILLVVVLTILTHRANGSQQTQFGDLYFAAIRIHSLGGYLKRTSVSSTICYPSVGIGN